MSGEYLQMLRRIAATNGLPFRVLNRHEILTVDALESMDLAVWVRDKFLAAHITSMGLAEIRKADQQRGMVRT
jgi:hypothetical protein